jgi:hypothetical protein
MVFLLKFIRGILKAITSSAAPWQVGVGAGLGILLGFLPIMPSAYGPAPLGLGLLVLAIFINCHFGSVLMFLAVGKVLSLLLSGVALSLGQACDGLARWAADVPILYASLWSHTGYLGLTILGFICAPVVGIAMAWFTVWFRAKVVAKLAERKRLMTTGKVAGNFVVFRILVWFLGM